MEVIKTFKQLCDLHKTDKSTYHGYHYFYPMFIEKLRNDTFNMLEIGYFKGKSLKVWKDYFPNAFIYVMDIDFDLSDDRSKVIKGDQSKLKDIVNVANVVKTAKFIIDDGSHHPDHQWETFSYFFNNVLEPGGIYIIEDIECSWWNHAAACYGYKIKGATILDKLNSFVHEINHEYSGLENKQNISSITYGQNCVIITKRTEEEANYFNRTYRYPKKLKNL